VLSFYALNNFDAPNNPSESINELVEVLRENTDLISAAYLQTGREVPSPSYSPIDS
jgi:hypothetical protein